MIIRNRTSGSLPAAFFLFALASGVAGKELPILQMKTIADTGVWSAQGGAQRSFSTENLGSGRAGWIKATFSGAGQRIGLAIPHLSPMPRYQTNYLPTLVSPLNFWRGYDSFKIDCFNPGAQASTVNIDISDFIATIVAEKVAPQGFVPLGALPGYRYQTSVVVAPGLQTITVNIAVPLRAANGERDISTLDVRGVGISLVSPAQATLYFDNFRLEGTSALAGTYGYVWPPWGKTQCTNPYDTLAKDAITKVTYSDHFTTLHQLGFQDPYASHCPFCGYALRSAPLEPQSGGENILVAPSQSHYVTTSDGGGGYGTAAKPYITDYVHHYDEGFYIWDARGFYEFDLSGVTKSVKKAEFRFYVPPTTSPNLVNSKVWFPPAQIWSVEDKYDNWASGGVAYIKQPPLKQLLVQGGLYPWNPDRFLRGGDGPLLTNVSYYGLDVTRYINEQRLGDKKAVMALLSTVSYPANSDPHGYGHFILMSGGAGGTNQRVHLYVEYGTPPEISKIVSVVPVKPWARFVSPGELSYYLPKTTRVKIAVSNIFGRQCLPLIDDLMESGTHTETYDMNRFPNLGSGVYFLRMETEMGAQTRRFVHTGKNPR